MSNELTQLTDIHNRAEAALATLVAIAGESTTARRAVTSLLFAATEDQLKAFASCREMSLAVTNLQQSRMWRNEAVRLWGEADSFPST